MSLDLTTERGKPGPDERMQRQGQSVIKTSVKGQYYHHDRWPEGRLQREGCGMDFDVKETSHAEWAEGGASRGRLGEGLQGDGLAGHGG